MPFRVHAYVLCAVLLSAALGAPRALAGAPQGTDLPDRMYFSSPEQAVEVATDLLKAENWPLLARYYDLTGTGIDRAELESGRFFIRTERPEGAHPAGFWRYRHPFAPGFRFSTTLRTQTPDVIGVEVTIEIDQGDGRVQSGVSSFLMRRSLAGYQFLPPQDEQGDGGQLEIALAPDTVSLVPGVRADDLVVYLRNSGHRPVVLRAVQWVGYRPDSRVWVRQQYGSTSGRPEDGAIVHNTLSQRLTSLRFEAGLILPGELATVRAPLTVRPGGRHTLQVTYLPVGEDNNWYQEVLLPEGSGAGFDEVYKPATEESVRARNGVTGVLAIVRSTMLPGADANGLLSQRASLELPLAGETDAARQTGGLSLSAAALRAGIALEVDDYYAFYRAPLRSWFFAHPDGRAVAVRREGAEPDTEAGELPAEEAWEKVALPDMDTTVPDQLGIGEEGATAMLLRPDVFDDVTKVNTPYSKMYYYPGETLLAPNVLWQVLARARERALPAHLVVIDPNGLGTEEVLTVGVRVDLSGRWEDPAIAPRDVPLDQE